MASAQERIHWYVKRTKIAFDALKEEFKYDEVPHAELRALAVQIACADGVVDELESITDAINHIECAS